MSEIELEGVLPLCCEGIGIGSLKRDIKCSSNTMVRRHNDLLQLRKVVG